MIYLQFFLTLLVENDVLIIKLWSNLFIVCYGVGMNNNSVNLNFI